MAGKFELLQQSIQVQFSNMALLKQAFTHASYRNEHRGENGQDNERLEFLGDAVLELLISEYLFDRYPTLPEGELTRMRASIVCEPSLVRFATKLQFNKYIRLGRGEELSGGRRRPALLADVFEAFMGALYLDQGLEAVRSFLQSYVLPELDENVHGLLLSDFKTLLQEHVQRENMGNLHYKIMEERGPAHNREFVSQVLVNDTPYGTGVGRSKKEAEQHAAHETLKMLGR